MWAYVSNPLSEQSGNPRTTSKEPAGAWPAESLLCPGECLGLEREIMGLSGRKTELDATIITINGGDTFERNNQRMNPKFSQPLPTFLSDPSTMLVKGTELPSK